MLNTTSKSHMGRLSHDVTKSPLLGFFLSQIKDIYWAEKYLIKTLPTMKDSAALPELREVFERHLRQTEEHVTRLEDVFDLLGERFVTTKSEDMECLVEESQTFIDETEDGSVVRDFSLIIAAQKIKHYEIASYNGLVQLAKTLGLEDIREILEDTLLEEKQADKLLSAIVENCLSCEATEA